MKFAYRTQFKYVGGLIYYVTDDNEIYDYSLSEDKWYHRNVSITDQDLIDQLELAKQNFSKSKL
jgi:hypothetical protein